MNFFDFSILTYLNSFVDHYPLIDVLITRTQKNTLLKGGVLLAIWWYLWSQSTSELHRYPNREKLLAGLIAMIAGLIVARALTYVLPFRVRPSSNPELHFIIPNWKGIPPPLEDWSAFPSDHAVVWFSIAASIYLVSKSLGWLTITYVSLLSIGRIYSGYHHPTDMLAGAALGVLAVYACKSERVIRHMISPILKFSEAKPGVFYAGLFLFTYQISNMFDQVREIASYAWRIINLAV